MLNLVTTCFVPATIRDLSENIRENVRNILTENESILCTFKCLNVAAFFTSKRMIFARIDNSYDLNEFEDLDFISYKCINKYTLSHSKKLNKTNVTLRINGIPIFLTEMSSERATELVQHIGNLTQ